MKPVPLQPNLPTPTTALGNPAPIAQYYICPHCHKQSPLVREWVGLTGEEIGLLTTGDDWAHLETPVLALFARAIEAKLKEKNAS